MKQKCDGNFSGSWLSIQLQLKALLEEVGGDHALEFLDTLCRLNQSEQVVALKVFSEVIGRIADGSQRLTTEGDLALKNFEDSLYKDIITSMQEASRSGLTNRMEVVAGGKNAITTQKRPIDLEEARRARKLREKPLLN